MKAKSKKGTGVSAQNDEESGSGGNLRPGEKEGQLYTFDDVPKYRRVYYMGRLGWVVQKGHTVREGSDGRHIKIQYKEKHANRKYSKIHEKLVNRFLRNKKRLWVDFDGRFEEYKE